MTFEAYHDSWVQTTAGNRINKPCRQSLNVEFIEINDREEGKEREKERQGKEEKSGRGDGGMQRPLCLFRRTAAEKEGVLLKGPLHLHTVSELLARCRFYRGRIKVFLYINDYN